MNKFIHHEGRLNNNTQKWKKEKEKENYGLRILLDLELLM